VENVPRHLRRRRMSFIDMKKIIANSQVKKKPMKKPQKGGTPKKITTKPPKRPRADGTTR
jgi:hypothetical protein